MGKSNSSRDWTQIYAIYGMDQWQTLLFLLCHAVFFSLLSILFLFYFDSIFHFFQTFLSNPSAARFAAGFSGAVTAISAVCLFFAAANFFYSAGPLHYDMAQRMVGSVNDWSTVKLALDIGCGRGILLNAVATQLKKTGSSGRVVGLDRSKRTTLSTLRTANVEGLWLFMFFFFFNSSLIFFYQLLVNNKFIIINMIWIKLENLGDLKSNTIMWYNILPILCNKFQFFNN